MAIAGLRGTGDWATGERPENFRELILWRDPNGSAPLVALTSKMKKRGTDDPKFHWFEEEQNILRIQVNQTDVVATTTSITIDQMEATHAKAGDQFLVETAENVAYDAEIIELSADPANTTVIVVTRGAAGTTAASIADDIWLTKIGSAYAEGTGAPKAASRNPTPKYNLAMIQKDTYELTGTAKETKTRTGDPVANDKKRKAHDHAVAMEYQWLFGKRYETTGSNGKPKRYTGGLLYFLADAYANDSATHCMKIWTTAATEDTFLDATYKMFDFNTSAGGAGNERIGFVGNGYLNTLNKMVKDSASTRINYEGTIRLYGMELQKFVLPQGTLYFKSHPLFNLHGRYTNSAIYIDPGNITYRPMKNRDTRMKDGIQGNDEDTQKGQWITEGGIEFNHLKTMQYQGAFQ
jgi:hypothetical protein